MARQLILALAILFATASPAFAQDAPDMEESKDFDVSATLAAVSDYRFRGVSLSGREPAIQPSVDVEHVSGFYAGAWGSTLGDAGGADVELDLYGGWRGKAGSLDLDVGAVAYLYPDARDLDYVELSASAAYTLGPASLKLGLAYAPDQSNVGGDNVYVYGDASLGVPGTPVTVTAHIGHENGPFGGPDGDKLDWSLGGEVVLDRFTLGLSYVDTDVRRPLDPGRVARAGIVASLKFGF